MQNKKLFIEVVKEAFADVGGFESYIEKETEENRGILLKDYEEFLSGASATLSEKGASLLAALQKIDIPSAGLSAKEISSVCEITGKAVAGTMRGLINLHFVEKIGEKPAMYKLTDNGKEYQFDNK